jgi:hypothetical protein
MDDDATEATFAGRVLVRDGEFLIECELPGAGSGVRLAAFRSYQLDGSFLVPAPDGLAWIFLDGRTDGPVRWRLVDTGPDRDDGARQMADLGVRVLDVEQAQAEFAAAGIPIMDVT